MPANSPTFVFDNYFFAWNCRVAEQYFVCAKTWKKSRAAGGEKENIARRSIRNEHQWLSTPWKQGGHILTLAPTNSELKFRRDLFSGAVSDSDGGALMGSTNV